MASQPGACYLPTDLADILFQSISTLLRGRFLLSCRHYWSLYAENVNFWTAVFVESGLSLTERDSVLARGRPVDAVSLRKDIALSHASVSKLAALAPHEMRVELVAGVPGWLDPQPHVLDLRCFTIRDSLVFVHIDRKSRQPPPDSGLGRHTLLCSAFDVVNFGRIENHDTPFADVLSSIGEHQPALLGAGVLEHEGRYFRFSDDGNGLLNEFQLEDSVGEVLRRVSRGDLAGAATCAAGLAPAPPDATRLLPFDSPALNCHLAIGTQGCCSGAGSFSQTLLLTVGEKKEAILTVFDARSLSISHVSTLLHIPAGVPQPGQSPTDGRHMGQYFFYWINRSFLLVYNLFDKIDKELGTLVPVFCFRHADLGRRCQSTFAANKLFLCPSESSGCYVADLTAAPRYSKGDPVRELPLVALFDNHRRLVAHSSGHLVSLQPESHYGGAEHVEVKIFDAVSLRQLVELPPCSKFQFIDSQRAAACIFGGFYHIEFFPPPPSEQSATAAPTMNIGVLSGELAESDADSRMDKRRSALVAVEPRNLSNFICAALRVESLAEVHLISVSLGYVHMRRIIFFAPKTQTMV